MKKILLIASIILVVSSLTKGQVQYNASVYHQFNTNYGYTRVGANNDHHSHFITDRPDFYFNKDLCIGGSNKVFAYDNNLSLEASPNNYVQVKPHNANYGLVVRDDNTNSYLNIRCTNLEQRQGVAFSYNSTDKDLFIEEGGGIHIRKNLFFPLGSMITIGNGNAGHSRLRIASGENTYIDYKDNIFFRADKAWITALTLYGNGTVGIGFPTLYTTGQYQNMGYKLAVNGGIVCEELKVIEDVPEADYVFEPDYPLESLKKVESYIKQNKHLPNIPSAKAFREAGYSVGEMDEMLLRKVEELTLYIIEQQKRIEALEAEKRAE